MLKHFRTEVVCHLLLEYLPVDGGKVHQCELLGRHLVQVALRHALSRMIARLAVGVASIQFDSTLVVLLIDLARRHHGVPDGVTLLRLGVLLAIGRRRKCSVRLRFAIVN